MTNNAYRRVVRALASQQFFYAVLAICALQAIWFAFSFSPNIFDEPHHIDFVYIYLNHLSPFLSQQDTSWDHLGAVTRESSYLFYYIMSFPLRVIRVFTDDVTAQIIALRLICTAFFIGGLVLYRKALLAITTRRAVVNVMLLFFVLTPAVALLPGAVSYDNLAFLLFALVLFLSVKIIKSRSVNFLNASSLLSVGLLMCLVKWSFVALLLPILLYVIYQLYKMHGSKIFSKLIRSAQKTSRPWLILAIVGLILSAGLFIERPVLNTIKYGRPDPSCVKLLDHNRCMKNSTYKAYAELSANKPDGSQPNNPVVYFLKYWTPKMIDTQVNQLERTFSQIIGAQILFTVFAFIGVVVVLMYLRDFLKNKHYRFLLIVMIVYVLILFTHEYLSYTKYGVPAAVRSRYLIPVLPIFMYFVALAIVSMFDKHKRLLLVLGCFVLLSFSQGGGTITFLLTTPEKRYWPNTAAESLNNNLKRIVQPVVKE